MDANDSGGSSSIAATARIMSAEEEAMRTLRSIARSSKDESEDLGTVVTMLDSALNKDVATIWEGSENSWTVVRLYQPLPASILVLS